MDGVTLKLIVPVADAHNVGLVKFNPLITGVWFTTTFAVPSPEIQFVLIVEVAVTV